MDKANGYGYKLTVHDVSKVRLKPEFNEEKRFEVLKGLATTSIGLIGSILSTEKIILKGSPGIFVKGEITQGVKEPPYSPVFVKAYLVTNRIYQLEFMCKPGKKDNPEIERFFNSFELSK